jgi:hypothetical protein
MNPLRWNEVGGKARGSVAQAGPMPWLNAATPRAHPGTAPEGRKTHPPSPLPCARSAWEGGDPFLPGTQGGGPPALRSGGPCPGLIYTAPLGQKSAALCAGELDFGRSVGHAYRKLGPGGTSDNSPAFQRRGGEKRDSRPEGTIENTPCPQPSLRDGWMLSIRSPGVETPGYSRKPLRGKGVSRTDRRL